MKLEKELSYLRRNLDGLRNLDRLPGAVYVIDPTVEVHAVREANLLHIPVVAMCDTDSDPDLVDYPIPGNDDAIKSTRLITARIADAVIEGREGFQGVEAPTEPTTPEVMPKPELIEIETDSHLMEMWEELAGEEGKD